MYIPHLCACAVRTDAAGTNDAQRVVFELTGVRVLSDIFVTFLSPTVVLPGNGQFFSFCDCLVSERFVPFNCTYCRSQWPRGLRRRSTAACLLGVWVRIPPGAWMSVCCECCVLSGRGLCDELITHPEESYGCLL